MAGKPVLIAEGEQPAECACNVLIVSGLPWHVTEEQMRRALEELYPRAAPSTVRFYTDPRNGASRGHCFLEYPADARGNGGGEAAESGASPSDGGGEGGGARVDHLAAVREVVVARGVRRWPVVARLYYLGPLPRWDRAGNLPDLPFDPPRLLAVPRVRAGYGQLGYTVAAGDELGLPNTVSARGAAKMRALRKRLRSKRSRSESAAAGGGIGGGGGMGVGVAMGGGGVLSGGGGVGS